MRDWLDKNWDWLVALVFLSVATSTAIGLKEGSKGGAIFVSNLTAALVAVALYPFLEIFGYAKTSIGILALFCGGCGVAMFKVLISLSDLIDRRRERLADSVLNRIVPDAKDDP